MVHDVLIVLHYSTPTRQSDGLGKWLKMFFGFQFSCHEEIKDAFLELNAVCSNEYIKRIFSDYVLNNYNIKLGCPFNAKLWTFG